MYLLQDTPFFVRDGYVYTDFPSMPSANEPEQARARELSEKVFQDKYVICLRPVVASSPPALFRRDVQRARERMTASLAAPAAPPKQEQSSEQNAGTNAQEHSK